MHDAAACADHELRMLETMVDCAFGLSVRLSDAAKAETDTAALVTLTDAYCRTSQAVRLGIRLSHTLRAPPKPAQPKAETLEAEPAETAERLERPDCGPARDRERERDYEPVSLPRFLATLGLVARDAERLADQLPADVATHTLPALRDLLARAKTDPLETKAPPAGPAASSPTAVLTRPRPPASKAALLGSASAPPPRPLALRGPNLPRPPPRRPR